MSRVLKDKIRIFIRYRMLDDNGAEIKLKTLWLCSSIRNRNSKNPIRTYTVE